MFENIVNFFKNIGKKEAKTKNKDTAKERLHLVLMQDRANVSADFLELMKQEIIDVIKKYIDVDENQIDVKLTNQQNTDGTNGAPALYANIPIKSIKNEARKVEISKEEKVTEEAKSKENKVEEKTEENKEKSVEKDTITDEEKINKTEEKTEKVKENSEVKKEEKNEENVEENSIKKEDKEKVTEEVKNKENKIEEKTEQKKE